MIHEILWRRAGGFIGMVKSGMGCQRQADCPGLGNQSQKDGESSSSYEGCDFPELCHAVVSG